MRKTLRNWLDQGSLALMPLLLAQAGKGPTVKSEEIRTTQPAESPTTSAISELLKEWWLWGGIVVLIGLVGLFIYLRNQREDDED